MSFMSMPAERLIKPEGDTAAKIAIVGDYTSGFDDNALKPFQGYGGSVLENCLHLAGLIRAEVYLTHLFKARAKRSPPKSVQGPCPEFFLENKCTFTEAGERHLRRLREELDGSACNVIVACGRAASVALAAVPQIAAKRGYVFPSVGLQRVRKVIPTHHPSSCFRGNFTNKHMIVCDLKKAKAESMYPELLRPQRHLVYEYSSVEEALQWIEAFMGKPELSVDIEVINFEVSCINLAVDNKIGVVIPLADRWTLDEEALLWRALAKLLGDPTTVKILQNAIFDIQFMLSRYGLEIKGPIRDTMVGHSCMYPELPKGLGFLGSIYCGSQAYWKDMVKFDDIKENS